MEDRILKSIIEITRHRDLDSLEYAFVATVYELVAANSVALYRIPEGNAGDDLEEIVRLEIQRNTRGEDGYSWTKEPHLVHASDSMLETIRGATTRWVTRADDQVELEVPIISGDKATGVLCVVASEAFQQYVEIIEAYATIYGNYMTVLHESEHDKLTGLLNRRTFDNKLSRLLKTQAIHAAAAEDNGNAESDRQNWLAVLDVDHFKRINDSYGHVYGDEILLLLSQKMKGYFRPQDLLFRVGGEEFVIVLAPVSAARAHDLMEGFRALISEMRFPNVREVTLSIGYAGIQPGDYPRRIFDLADKALYFAKQNGRNQVWRYDTLVERKLLAEEDLSGSIELF